jgi:hypothetical protein
MILGKDYPLHHHFARSDDRGNDPGQGWFRCPFAGSMLLLFFATCLFLLSTSGRFSSSPTVSGHPQQAMKTTFLFILPFFMLSALSSQ